MSFAHGFHWPDLETLRWMVIAGVGAGLAHWLYFSLYRGLPEWRIRLSLWRGREPSPADIADTQGYRSNPPEPLEQGLLHSAGAGLLVAGWVWTSDYSGMQGDALLRVGEALALALVLLWSFRKPRGEVGAPPVEEAPDKKHSWWTVLLLLGAAAFAWFDPVELLEPIFGFNLIIPFFALFAVACGLFQLWKARGQPADDTEVSVFDAQDHGILMLVTAAVLLAAWGLSWITIA